MLPARVEPKADVIYQPLEDELVLLNMKDQRYFALDDVGTAVWRLLLEHKDLEAVADRLCAEYDVDGPTVRNDLSILIQKLQDAGLVDVLEKVPLP